MAAPLMQDSFWSTSTFNVLMDYRIVGNWQEQLLEYFNILCVDGIPDSWKLPVVRPLQKGLCKLKTSKQPTYVPLLNYIKYADLENWTI